MNKAILAFPFLLMALPMKAQKTAPLWVDFVKAKQAGKTPALPDFSYAGYHWSERNLPAPEGKKIFKVDDYGAIPNDEKYDDEAIQKAVDAAAANPEGGLFFSTLESTSWPPMEMLKNRSGFPKAGSF